MQEMEEPGSSRWALVIRDDGEASVVPLSDVPVIHEEGAGIVDKTPTVIVLQTQEQDEATGGCCVGSHVTENISEDADGRERSRTSAESITDLISLSAGQVEDSVDHLGGAVITIADASQPPSPIESSTLENIEIRVLTHEETAHTTHTSELNDGTKCCKSKETECIARVNPVVSVANNKTSLSGSCGNEISNKIITVRHAVKMGIETEEVKTEDLEYNFVNKENIEEQKKEDFFYKH